MATPDNQQLLASLHTLAQSQAALLVESKITNLALQCPTFNGTDVSTFSVWHQTIEKFVPDLTASELLHLVRRTLTGSALADFLSYIRAADGSYQPKTWPAIVTFLRSKFLNPNVAFSLRAGLNAIRFVTGEHPTVYRDRLLSHARLVFSDDELATRLQDQIAAYVNGLSDRALKLALIRQGKTTLQALVDEHVNWHTAELALQGTGGATSPPPRQVRFSDDQLDEVRTELHTIANTLERLNIKSVEHDQNIQHLAHDYNHREFPISSRPSRWDRYADQYDDSHFFTPPRRYSPHHLAFPATEYTGPPPYRNQTRSPSPAYAYRSSFRGYAAHRGPPPNQYYRGRSLQPYAPWQHRSPNRYHPNAREWHSFPPPQRYFHPDDRRPSHYSSYGDTRPRPHTNEVPRSHERPAYHQQRNPPYYHHDRTYDHDRYRTSPSPSRQRFTPFRDRTPSPVKRARPEDDDFDRMRFPPAPVSPQRPILTAGRRQSSSVQELTHDDEHLDAMTSLFANPVEDTDPLNSHSSAESLQARRA